MQLCKVLLPATVGHPVAHFPLPCALSALLQRGTVNWTCLHRDCLYPGGARRTLSTVAQDTEALPDFENGREAFKWKTSWEICRALGILRMCAVETLVNHSFQMMTSCERLFGRRVLRFFLKPTVYKQFIGGETSDEIFASVQRVQDLGIRPMLTCTLEEDVGEGGNEDMYDRNCARIMNMLRMSKVMCSTETLFQLKLSGFFSANLLFAIGDIFRSTSDKDTLITAIAEGLSSGHVQMKPFLKTLTESQQRSLRLGVERLKRVGEEGRSNHVKLLIDAEYTYLNSGLSLLALAMMVAFNRTAPLVWNTYQCYLKGAADSITSELFLTQKMGVCFGAKIVRGAYMVQERARAVQLGYPDPICDTYKDTCSNYNRVLDIMLDHIEDVGPVCNIIVATHNTESIKLALRRMKQLKIDRQNGGVHFGQLYGMCDQITFPLANENYAVYKSIPYGTVEEVLPYLARRAVENRSVLDGCRQEQQLLWGELKTRMLNKLLWRSLFYKPAAS